MNFPRLIWLCFLCCASAFGATLSGRITDTEGAVIANAHVVIHWDASGSTYVKDNLGTKQDVVLSTDHDGSFSAEIPPGFYDVFVSAAAFSPYCEKVRVREAQKRPFKARLKVSAVTSKELD